MREILPGSLSRRSHDFFGLVNVAAYFLGLAFWFMLLVIILYNITTPL
jgi:hypothetical protein